MNDILKKLAQKANIDFSSPAEEKAISKAEKRLKMQLPNDYKTFLQFTNGFPSTDFTEPTFLPIEEIDFLKNIDADTIEAYSTEGVEYFSEPLSRSILVAGKDEEQYFLLIPPKKDEDSWKYWKFANWIPGEHEHENLEEYFKDVLVFLEEIEE